MTPNRRREITEKVGRQYRRLQKEPNLTIEEINDDVVSIEERFVADLCGCDRRWLEDMGVTL